MSPATDLEAAARTDASRVAQRSATYQQLGAAFRYPAAETPPDPALALPPRSRDAGAEFLAAFDPGVSADACSLHEADYAGEERSAVVEELLRFYSFFGLAREAASELPDHVVVELEFMHYLTFLEWRAVQEGTPVTGLRRAQRDFLTRHLARVTRGMATRCPSGDPHYATLVARLTAFVEDELRQLA
ncbi:MAG: molecular chaperone TorD family protein [Myxococcota bacterium]|nr:molecular chaperone TorD family protein [Myxococcota bacterium]